MEDVQKVVEQGCPNLLRKAVNSAKRLRAYARLDEGDVCYYYYYFLFIALQCELKNGEVKINIIYFKILMEVYLMKFQLILNF